MRPFRIIALAEATSFIALLVATYVKRTDGGEVGVSVLGPIHGALFIAYVVVALNLLGWEGWLADAGVLRWIVGAVLVLDGGTDLAAALTLRRRR